MCYCVQREGEVVERLTLVRCVFFVTGAKGEGREREKGRVCVLFCLAVRMNR